MTPYVLFCPPGHPDPLHFSSGPGAPYCSVGGPGLAKPKALDKAWLRAWLLAISLRV